MIASFSGGGGVSDSVITHHAFEEGVVRVLARDRFVALVPETDFLGGIVGAACALVFLIWTKSKQGCYCDYRSLHPHLGLPSGPVNMYQLGGNGVSIA